MSGRADEFEPSGGADSAAPDPFGDAESAIELNEEMPQRPTRPDRAGVWPPKPGIFAAVWPLYLLVGGLAGAAPFMSAKYVDDSIALPAVVSILSAFVLGLTVMLPLLRLSQSRSSDPVLESAMDAFSLLLPVQPLIWFTVVRPIGFGAERVSAADLLIVGWTALVSGIVGLTLAQEVPERPDRVRRTLGMILVIGLQGAGPGVFMVASWFGWEAPEGISRFGPVGSVASILGQPRDPVPGVAWVPVASVWLLSMGGWWIALAERRNVLACGRRSGGPASGT
jgi:hypothetical protein